MDKLGRKALITGGGGAIAASIAERLDKRGYQLVLADIDVARAEQVAQSLRQPCAVLHADLSTAQGIAALGERIERDYADLSLLVNNAGYILPGNVVQLDAEAIDRHVQINLVAPMQLTRVVARFMRERGGGDILSIVSMGGILSLRGSASYSAAKFGLRGFQQAIHAELLKDGVRVMGVFPSGVDTPMLRLEAMHPGGSPLNFVGEVLTADQVGDACMRALSSGALETYLPYSDSILTRLVGSFPWLIHRVEPFFVRLGERGRSKFIATRGLDG
ncbi:MAG: SDR family NAD(P)-dependent oxidoreductase [Myxococcota bacterium]